MIIFFRIDLVKIIITHNHIKKWKTNQAATEFVAQTYRCTIVIQNAFLFVFLTFVTFGEETLT